MFHVVYKGAKLADGRETDVLNPHRRIRIVRQSAPDGRFFTAGLDKGRLNCTGAPGDFTDFGRSSLQVLLAEVPQVARSGEAAHVGNLLKGHVRVRQQGGHVRLPLFRQPAVRSGVQLLLETPSQRIDRHGAFPCQFLHVLHLGQSQYDFFPERAAPQVRQVLFHLLQVRLAEHRRYALAVLGRPFTAEAEQQSRQTVAEHVQVRVFVVGVDACLHPAEEQESSAVPFPEIRLRRFQQEV